MPTAICSGCKRQTNSVCSHYDYSKKTAEYCYAAWDNGDDGDNKWVKGCGFDKADDFSKAYAMHLITGKPVEKFLEKRKRS